MQSKSNFHYFSFNCNWYSHNCNLCWWKASHHILGPIIILASVQFSVYLAHSTQKHFILVKVQLSFSGALCVKGLSGVLDSVRQDAGTNLHVTTNFRGHGSSNHKILILFWSQHIIKSLLSPLICLGMSYLWQTVLKYDSTPYYTYNHLHRNHSFITWTVYFELLFLT